jgi:L-lactate dehydrogenase complex protein LldE
MKTESPISLFIPCLVDQVYPEIGIAMAKILEHLGCKINYNNRQTCCGQPAFNAGHRDEACKVAAAFINTFNQAETIVGPSGSCTAMVKNYYPVLFPNGKMQDPASQLGKKTFEFSQFIVNNNLTENIVGSYNGKIGFHNSCHSAQELGIKNEPIDILSRIEGLEVVIPDQFSCCGFGGLFSFKFDEIGSTMAKTRIESFTNLDLRVVVTNDPGCLMHMRQEAKFLKLDMTFYHLTEFLVMAMNL